MQGLFTPETLEIASDFASVATAIVAVLAYGRYVVDRRLKRHVVERFLKDEMAARDDPATDGGGRTAMFIGAEVGLTEADVMQAALSSKRIRRVPGRGAPPPGITTHVWYEYCG